MNLNACTLYDGLSKFMPWYWVNQNIHISLKSKYVYFETPKVCCSTIKKTLIKHECGELFDKYDLPIHPVPFSSVFVKPYQISAHQFIEILRDPNYFKFTFVRNPYSRALSGYLDKIVAKRSGYTQMISAMPDKTENEDISFEEFLVALSDMPPRVMNSHFRPQYNQIFGLNTQMSFIGTFENFAVDFDRLLTMLSIGRNIVEERRFHQTNADQKLSEFYDANTIELVKEIYKDDFRAFNYSLDFPQFEK